MGRPPKIGQGKCQERWAESDEFSGAVTVYSTGWGVL